MGTRVGVGLAFKTARAVSVPATHGVGPASAVSVPATHGVNAGVVSIGTPGVCEQAERATETCG